MRMDAESIAMMNKEIQTREKSKIVIPDNATNGDVIRALFPYVLRSNYIINNAITVYLNDDNKMVVSEDWWNAPYKENNNANAN